LIIIAQTIDFTREFLSSGAVIPHKHSKIG